MNKKGCKARAFVVLLPLLMLIGGAGQVLGAEKGKLAFVRNGGIWIANSDGTDARQLTPLGEGPALSPDGKSVAFTYKRQISLISTQGGNPRAAISSKAIKSANSVSFSPDGRYLVFRGYSECRKDESGEEGCLVSVWLAGLVDHSLQKIISRRGNFVEMDILAAPNMPADGRLIVYTESDHEPTGGFRVINLQGKQIFHYPRDLRDKKPYQFARFSPDGQTLLCCSYGLFTEPKSANSPRHGIFLINMSNNSGAAIVFEKDQLLPGDRSQTDLYRLELTPDAQPRKILENAEQPG
jgi:Tol biopolymer transport system component